MENTTFVPRRGYAATDILFYILFFALILLIIGIADFKIGGITHYIMHKNDVAPLSISGLVKDVEYLATNSFYSPVVIEFHDGRVCNLHVDRDTSVIIHKNKVNTFYLKNGNNIVSSIVVEETPN